MGKRTGIVDEDRRFLRIAVPIAAYVGGLCCFTPVVVVLLGIGSVSYAASLTDILYYEYGWAFRLAGLAFVLAALVVHLYSSGVCSIDAARRHRQRIVTLGVLTLTGAILVYVVWLSVFVEIVGLLLGIW